MLWLVACNGLAFYPGGISITQSTQSTEPLQGWTLNFESTCHLGEWPWKSLTLSWASGRVLMSNPTLHPFPNFFPVKISKKGSLPPETQVSSWFNPDSFASWCSYHQTDVICRNYWQTHEVFARCGTSYTAMKTTHKEKYLVITKKEISHIAI